MQLFALLRLGFPSAPFFKKLNLATYHNSLARSTKSTRSLALPLLVSIRFQVLFHSPPGVLFTFPSRYCFTIGHQVVFRLGGWSLRLPARFLVSCGTLVPASRVGLSSTGLSPSLAALSNALPLDVHDAFCRPATPKSMLFGLASFPFARRYLGNRCFFLFLRVLRCFSSPRALLMTYGFSHG